jgi:hypothetical protein
MPRFLLLLMALFTFSCSTKQNDKGTQQILEPVSDGVASVYEGRIPLDDKRNIFFEISLTPSVNANEGTYTLTEFIEAEEVVSGNFSAKGLYSAIDNKMGEREFYLQNSARPDKLKRIYQTETGSIREENFRNKDLVIQSADNNMMTVLDNNATPVSTAFQYKLVKRASDLFTIEGYFRHKGDTSEFFEMNTERTWPVLKLGAYMEAARQYYKLATKKGEPVYLKGTAYTVDLTTKGNKKIKALIFKRVIQTTGVFTSN